MFGFDYIRVLPLDIWGRCPIGSLLRPLEIREGSGLELSAYKRYLRPKTALVHLKSQYIPRKESLRTESSATLTFRAGTGGRTNIREQEGA